MSVKLKKGVGINTLKLFGFSEFAIQSSTGIVVDMESGEIYSAREPNKQTEKMVERLIEYDLVEE